jgi:hypothetical protein
MMETIIKDINNCIPFHIFYNYIRPKECDRINSSQRNLSKFLHVTNVSILRVCNRNFDRSIIFLQSQNSSLPRSHGSTC